MKNRYDGGFFTLLGLLLVIVIIYILSHIIFKAYFRRPASKEEIEEIRESLPGQSSGSHSYQTILDSTRETMKDINKQYINRAKQLKDLDR